MRETPNALTVSEDFEFKALSLADNYRAALLHEFSTVLRGRVLEVGAGIGQLTEALLQNPGIAQLLSIEPHPVFFSQLQKKFPGHTVMNGTIYDLRDEDHWDAVVSINVLEHIRDDETELKNYHDRLLKNNGTLCLFVPARPEIYAPIDKDFGHFRRYTRRELREKLERAGFQIQQLHYYNIAGYLAWWLNFCLLRRRHFNAGSVRFFDRFIFPPVHGFESRVCRPFIGQSLLATARAK
ncbi:MAG TPA: class I SAM-dependent methyltransferase [Candidatus Acidoferrales bacterium]|jgi:SAM-dependent methyltransferase|nr:class I SAM-dependent methyltransferase [Candidatus Acidoferrales bacterium]